MHGSEFDHVLPRERIAPHPLPERVRAGGLLVLNDCRVSKARLRGEKGSDRRVGAIGYHGAGMS
jgi:S-adenosylmethionine:tRNA-ribosyltransferase-isomerase (queuine synthetase)